MKLLLIPILLLFLTSCDRTQTADEIDQYKQEVVQGQGIAQAGMPNITNFTELKLINLMYELRDNPKLVNYAYLQSEMTGKLVFVGKCMGYPVPYSTQRSNPQKIVHPYTGTAMGMPQAEPNGLFPPSTADGTIILMIDPTGKPVVCYFEPKVTVLPFKIDM
jgi:hypothetical protein